MLLSGWRRLSVPQSTSKSAVGNLLRDKAMLYEKVLREDYSFTTKVGCLSEVEESLLAFFGQDMQESAEDEVIGPSAPECIGVHQAFYYLLREVPVDHSQFSLGR